MKKGSSLLEQSLISLTQKELNDIDNWFASTWCVPNKNLRSLFKMIRQQHPNNTNYPIDKEQLFASFFNTKKYSPSLARKLLSELHKSLQEFLVFERVRKQQDIADKILTREFTERRHLRMARKVMNRYQERLANKPVKTWEDHLQLMEIRRVEYYEYGSVSTAIDSNQAPINLANIHLDQLYLLLKARFLSEIHSRKQVLNPQNAKTEVSADQKLQIQLLTLPACQKLPSIYFYNQLVLEKNPVESLDQFIALWDKFKRDIHQISYDDQEPILFYFLNTAGRIFRAGKRAILPNILEIYRYGLEHKILLRRKALTERTYINLVSIGCNLGETVFIQSFIKKYSPYLPATFRNETKVLAQAMVDYECRRFTACVNKIKDYQFRNASNKLRSKVLFVKAYFEETLLNTTYYTLHFNYCKTFLDYLKRQKGQGNIRTIGYIRFVQIILKLGKRINNQHVDHNFLQKIKLDIANSKNIHASKWLMEKIENLEAV